VRRRIEILTGLVAGGAAAAVIAVAWLLATPSARPITQPSCSIVYLGSPQVSASSGNQAYNIPVGGGYGGTWSDFAVSISDQNGTPIPTSATGWSLTVQNAQNADVASYDIRASSPAWTDGGGAILSTNQTIVLTAPASPSLIGATFDLLAVGGPCHGQSTVTLP
jgi:hypothetical protein